MSESLADTFKNNCLPPSACMDPSNGSLVISIPPKSIDSKVPSQSSSTGKPSSGFVNLRSAQIVDGVEQVSVHLHMCVCVSVKWRTKPITFSGLRQMIGTFVVSSFMLGSIALA